MKRTISFIFGFTCIAALASSALAQTAGDNIFFSTITSATTDPFTGLGTYDANGNLTLSSASTGSLTLGVWASAESSGNSDVWSDLGTTGGTQNSGSGFGVNYFMPATAVASLTGAAGNNRNLQAVAPATQVWDFVSTAPAVHANGASAPAGYPSGSSTIYNVNATVGLAANNFAGVDRGLRHGNGSGITGSYLGGSADIVYFLGTLTINKAAGGSVTIETRASNQAFVANDGGTQIQAGDGIFRGTAGGGSSTNLTSTFGYRTVALTVTTATARRGDLNNDTAVNATDIDLIMDDVRNGLTYAQAALAGRDDNVLQIVVNPSDPVSPAQVDFQAGQLADLNGDTSIGTGNGVGLSDPAHPKGTHYGNISLTGTVNFGDLQTVIGAFGTAVPGTAYWETGNFSYTGTVNFGDLQTTIGNFGVSGPGPAAVPGAAPVPEPTSLVLLGLGGIIGGIAIRRRSSK